MPKIMAITLHQPYASAIARGYKVLETRDWMPQYRGPLVIHAGKTLDTTVLARPDLMEFFRLVNINLFKLPLGAAVCICDLHAVYRTEDVLPKIGDHERMLGLAFEERAGIQPADKGARAAGPVELDAADSAGRRME